MEVQTRQWKVLVLIVVACLSTHVAGFLGHNAATLTNKIYPPNTIGSIRNSIRRTTTRRWSAVPHQASAADTPSSEVSKDNSLPPPTAIKHNRRKTRAMFQSAKLKEKAGRWKEASELLTTILEHDPTDAHTHLALARLEAKRGTDSSTSSSTPNSRGGSCRARAAFERGTQYCPDSVHLWQAWARFEEQQHKLPSPPERARALFQKALQVEAGNPYVCHSYGLMEQKLGFEETAEELWKQGLQTKPTAALVCSLAELMIAQKRLAEARDLYIQYGTQVETDRERTEIYLASAWLEEKYFRDCDRAEEWIKLALAQDPSSSGRAQVAWARLEGRRNRRANKSGKAATRKRLSEAVQSFENGESESTDGRLFNALAHVEVKSRNYLEARKILEKGIESFPDDVSLLNAAGRVEERMANMTGARLLYEVSLSRQPSAATLVALAMLELRHPGQKPSNYTAIKTYFERALLLDPRHGPAYNAYGNMEFRRGNVTEAREIYKRGVRADCSDPASVYHGLAKIELSLGNVDIAREILIHGLRRVEAQDRTMDSSRHERAVFLVHTLGMLELNSNRVVDAHKVFIDGLDRYERCSQLLLGAALCEVKLGSIDKARKLFERAVRADKKHAQAWQAWGVMESRAGNITVAKTLFQAGLKSSPRHGALWHAFGVLEGRMGNLQAARTYFEAGLRKCPNHVPLYQGWASIEMKADNLEKAKTLIGEALTRDKTVGSSWLVAAQIEQLQGNDGLVGLILRRGIECAPSEASLYRELGEHLVRKGQINEAREVLEKGLEVNPLHAPLYHSLAELEARIFNVEGLSKLNKRAKTIFTTNALEASPSSTQAWSNKIKMKSQRDVSGNVAAALADKIGYGIDDDDEDDPMITPIESMSEMEDAMVRDVFQD